MIPMHPITPATAMRIPDNRTPCPAFAVTSEFDRHKMRACSLRVCRNGNFFIVEDGTYPFSYGRGLRALGRPHRGLPIPHTTTDGIQVEMRGIPCAVHISHRFNGVIIRALVNDNLNPAELIRHGSNLLYATWLFKHVAKVLWLFDHPFQDKSKDELEQWIRSVVKLQGGKLKE